MSQDTNRYAALKAVFTRLPIDTDRSVHLEGAIKFLLNVDISGSGNRPEKFTDNDSKSVAELDKLEKLATKLANHIDGMHQTAIVAMPDWRVRNELLGTLRDTASKAHVAGLLESARLADLDKADQATTSKGGRPENLRAMAVTQIVGYYYTQLTGRQPYLINDAYKDDEEDRLGQFWTLVKDVFNVLGLEQNPEHYVRKYVDMSKEKTPEN